MTVTIIICVLLLLAYAFDVSAAFTKIPSVILLLLLGSIVRYVTTSLNIVQIMGSWCPNCLDETRYLSDWYNTTKPEDVRIIGLDYEKITDTTVAFRNIRRLADRYHVNYPILFGGSSNREEAGKTLPMLSRVFSFPTTIYVNKDGTVREIHSGFNGPATGQYFEDYKRGFAKLIEEMRKH